ncbi:MAG: helix-turn-helix transcriptional regulator [Nitrospirota bacterium]|nr:helix-turn-helix transcriptional regulator [Nitrospirota bacterium]
MDTRTQLGRRIRDLRKKRGLTQERLAEAASVDVKYLGSIERGKENPTIGTLEKLAVTLSVTVQQVLDCEHEVTGKRVLQRRITQALHDCDERELQIILRLVHSIKD